MVLAAMLKESVMKKAREEGRREGREIVRKEMRERRLKRWKEVFDRFGVEVGGMVMLPMTPEVEWFLDGDAAK